MTNHETSRRLLGEAAKAAEEMERYISKGDRNLTVRHAQEAIEFALKAYIAFFGLDYPKTHDPGPAFADVVREWGGPPPDVVERICALTFWLAEERAPVFYAEKDSTEEEARRAAEGARFVLDEVRRRLG